MHCQNCRLDPLFSFCRSHLHWRPPAARSSATAGGRSRSPRRRRAPHRRRARSTCAATSAPITARSCGFWTARSCCAATSAAMTTIRTTSIWQASFGHTARECLYNPDGSLTLKVGVSGRIISGPKGGAGQVSVPFKIAVVKFKESTLDTAGLHPDGRPVADRLRHLHRGARDHRARPRLKPRLYRLCRLRGRGLGPREGHRGGRSRPSRWSHASRLSRRSRRRPRRRRWSRNRRRSDASRTSCPRRAAASSCRNSGSHASEN